MITLSQGTILCTPTVVTLKKPAKSTPRADKNTVGLCSPYVVILYDNRGTESRQHPPHSLSTKTTPLALLQVLAKLSDKPIHLRRSTTPPGLQEDTKTCMARTLACAAHRTFSAAAGVHASHAGLCTNVYCTLEKYLRVLGGGCCVAAHGCCGTR